MAGASDTTSVGVGMIGPTNQGVTSGSTALRRGEKMSLRWRSSRRVSKEQRNNAQVSFLVETDEEVIWECAVVRGMLSLVRDPTSGFLFARSV